MSRHIQYAPFVGDLAPTMPSGEYLQIDTRQVDQTSNNTIAEVWDLISRAAQIVSTHPGAQQPEVTRELVQTCLTAIDHGFAHVATRIVTRANRTISDTYGGPNPYAFGAYPIRWPAESRLALAMVLKFVSSLHQIPHVGSNRLDNGILDNHAWVILMPLYDLKVQLMKTLFGLEVQGQISVDELQALYRGVALNPPLASSLADRGDPAAVLAAESARALENESAPIPDQETIEKVLAGVEAWTWAPGEPHWSVFAELARRLEMEGPTQAPAEPFPFTTGTIAGAGGGGGDPGGPTGAPGLVTPGA